MRQYAFTCSILSQSAAPVKSPLQVPPAPRACAQCLALLSTSREAGSGRTISVLLPKLHAVRRAQLSAADRQPSGCASCGEEDLHVMLGELHPQHLAAVDMRGRCSRHSRSERSSRGGALSSCTLRCRTRLPAAGFSAAFSIALKRSRRETPKRECGRALIRSMQSPIVRLIWARQVTCSRRCLIGIVNWV
jgi:hypothetical protein